MATAGDVAGDAASSTWLGAAAVVVVLFVVVVGVVVGSVVGVGAEPTVRVVISLDMGDETSDTDGCCCCCCWCQCACMDEGLVAVTVVFVTAAVFGCMSCKQAATVPVEVVDDDDDDDDEQASVNSPR